ncbi:hypothetical protein, partial [Klebsiella pneumoniae]|uniref:hypothetical protein n=1 Tax=Klebsiella pneumoniae TaxID=573 RepID=UPI0030135BD7
MLELLLNLFFFLPNAGALGSFSAATYILHQKSTMPVESNAQQSHEECMLTEKTTGEQLLDKGC